MVNESLPLQSTSGTMHFGRPRLDGIYLIGCVLCPAAVDRLRLPDVGAGEAQHSRHAADTDILLEPQGGHPPSSNPPWGG